MRFLEFNKLKEEDDTGVVIIRAKVEVKRLFKKSLVKVIDFIVEESWLGRVNFVEVRYADTGKSVEYDVNKAISYFYKLKIDEYKPMNKTL